MTKSKEIDRIGGKTGGIPRDKFQLGVKETIPGLSGSTLLKCNFTPTFLSINDVSDPDHYLFSAYLMGNNKILGFHVKTHRLEDSTSRHPDLYASALLTESLRYFEHQGFRPKILEGEWHPWSDNYRQYKEALKSLTEETENAQSTAAFETWTGRQAKKNGFTKVLSVETLSSQEVIIVQFGKPKIKRLLTRVLNPQSSLRRFRSQRRF